jgi:hypothetical protein
MKFIIIVCLILIALPISASDRNPESTLRCKTYVITSGASQSEVLRKCGDPFNIVSWEEERIIRDTYKNMPVQSQDELSQEPLFVKEYIQIEEWEYNFGPTRFIYYLRFENGKLERITSGEYGY